jgi:hypothetical protein
MDIAGQSGFDSRDAVRKPYPVDRGLQILICFTASSQVSKEKRARVCWASMGAERIFLAPPECFLYVLRRSGMRAMMNNFDIEDDTANGTRKWDGLSEIDQAIRDNRLTEYRIKKAWADPWSRALTIACLAILALFTAFVVYWDLLRG